MRRAHHLGIAGLSLIAMIYFGLILFGAVAWSAWTWPMIGAFGVYNLGSLLKGLYDRRHKPSGAANG